MRVSARRVPGGTDGALGYAHDVEIEGGHALRVDEPGDAGGGDTGPSPTRLVAAGLASCVAITIEMYAERKGWDLGPVEVDVDVAYEDYRPTSFEVSLRLRGGLDEDQRERLRRIAARCPVHRLIENETPVRVADRIEAL